MSANANFPHHAGGLLQVKHYVRWGSVPEALLEDPRLCLAARAVGAWITVKPDGWQIVVDVLRDRLGIGKDAWQRYAKEFEEAGYLTRFRVNGENGRWVWHITFTPTPEPAVTIAGFSGAGAAGAGSSIDGEAGHKVIPRDQEHSNHKQTTTTPSPPLAAAGGGRALVFERAVQHLADRLPSWLVGIDPEMAQLIVDELAGALEAAQAGKRLRIASPRDWTKRLVLAAKRGEFEPDLAVTVQRRRKRIEQQSSLQREAENGHAARVGTSQTQSGSEAIAKLKQRFGIREGK